MGKMKKFRIIEELYYDNDMKEHIIYYVQEWKKNIFRSWTWKYWRTWNYDVKENRKFGTQEEAKAMIERYVKRAPHKIVVEELSY